MTEQGPDGPPVTADEVGGGPAQFPIGPARSATNRRRLSRFMFAPQDQQEIRDGGGGARQDLSFLARGTVLNFVGVVASSLLSFVLVIVVTRGLKAGRAGVFFEAIALFTIVSNAAEMGADSGLLRMTPRFRALGRTHDLRRVMAIGLWPSLGVGVLGGVLLFVFAPQLAHLFFEGTFGGRETIDVLRAIAPFLPVSAVSSVVLAGTRGFGVMLPAVTIEYVGKPLVRPLIALGVVWVGLGTAALALGWAIPMAVGLGIGLVWLLGLLRRAEQRDWLHPDPSRPRRELALEFWRFSAPRGLAGALNTTQTWLDTLLIGGLISTAQSAIYTAASRYIVVGTFAIQAMQIAIAPQISGLLALRSQERARAVYQTATEWMMAPSWPIYFTLAIFAPVLLRVFGRQFVEGEMVLVILSLALLAVMATGPVNVVLVMGGKSGWTLTNSVVGLALNVILNLLLIPRLGIEGAAVAWAVTIVLTQIAAFIEVRLLLKLNPFGRGAIMVAVVSTLIYGGLGLAIRAALGASIPALMLFLVVSTVLYGGFLWRFRGTLKLTELAGGLRGGARGADLARGGR